MSPLLEVALGAIRVVLYIGYVLLAGILTFWILAWPEGNTDRRLVLMAGLGTGLMIVATIAEPALRLLSGARSPGDAVTPLTGAALIVRLAALAFMGFFLVDLVRAAITGWRRLASIVVVALIAATLVVQPNAVGGPWQLFKIIASSGHVLAVAAWLGGLLAFAEVLITHENLKELDWLIPAFSVVARYSVITLVVTGGIQALAIAGGFIPLVTSRYGLVLLIKVLLFGTMLVLGNRGRRYAARVAFRRVHPLADSANRAGIHRLAVVMGTEVAIAVVILVTTSLLVLAAPTA
ncbi:MAG: CopD family protein [Actinomycetota bacterium]|nr:CopD family protein [Actinomycetota bacterium]